MNQTPQRGPIARFFIGLWDAMNFTRRLILNLLFLVLLFLIAVGAAGRVAPLQSDTTLVLAPEGRLVEQYSSDALSRTYGSAADLYSPTLNRCTSTPSLSCNPSR